MLVYSIAGIANSQSVNAPIRLSVDEAGDYAVNFNRGVQSARIDVDYSHKKERETIAIGLPQVSVAANYQHQFTVPQLSFGSFLDPNLLPDGTITKNDIVNAYATAKPVPLGVKNNTVFDFTLSQLIFNGEYIVGLKAFKVLNSVAEKALVRTEYMARESASASYYTILALDENQKVLQESLVNARHTLDELAGMNREGFNEETDVDQMRINVSNLQTRLNTLVSQKELAVKLLKFQLGIDFEKEVILTDSLSGIIQQGNLRYLSDGKFDLNSSVDYQMIQTQERVSELELMREKSKMLPVITGFYRHQEQTNQPAFNFVVKDIAGVSLSLPIITSGQRLSTIGQAKLNLAKARLNTENIAQSLLMEYETAMNDYETAYSNYNTNRETMDLGKKIYDRAIIKYKEGVVSSFELSQNQTQFLTAQSNYYNSVLALLGAKAKLDRILSQNQK